MSYNHFAALYDTLMADAPYEAWLTYAKRYLPERGSVIDLACGTGTFTLLLAQRGYQTTGIDISQDMLTVAEEKARENGSNLDFYLQDMRELSGFKEVDAITIFCDGLNYLREEEDVLRTFQQVYKALKPGGILLFDVHSIFKMEQVFANQLYGENRESLSYMWFCEPGDEPFSVQHSFTFFIKKEDGTYERMDEEHRQRTFPPNRYEAWLIEAGFDQVEITREFGEGELEEDDRIFFKAVKK